MWGGSSHRNDQNVYPKIFKHKEHCLCLTLRCLFHWPKISAVFERPVHYMIICVNAQKQLKFKFEIFKHKKQCLCLRLYPLFHWPSILTVLERPVKHTIDCVHTQKDLKRYLKFSNTRNNAFAYNDFLYFIGQVCEVHPFEPWCFW